MGNIYTPTFINIKSQARKILTDVGWRKDGGTTMHNACVVQWGWPRSNNLQHCAVSMIKWDANERDAPVTQWNVASLFMMRRGQQRNCTCQLLYTALLNNSRVIELIVGHAVLAQWATIIISNNIGELYDCFISSLFGEEVYFTITYSRVQDTQLSQRDRAAWCIIVFTKSGRLQLGDNVYGHYRSIFNHCDIIDLKICRIRRKKNPK